MVWNRYLIRSNLKIILNYKSSSRVYATYPELLNLSNRDILLYIFGPFQLNVISATSTKKSMNTKKIINNQP
jgi:hypothetical protein